MSAYEIYFVINFIQEQVDKFAQAGIYTLFDMHQDCLWETDTDDLFKGTVQK